MPASGRISRFALLCGAASLSLNGNANLVFELTEVPRYRIVAQVNSRVLAQVGPLIPGALSRHDDQLGHEVRGEFLIDTGAYGAMIDLAVAESLQLRLQGSREVHGIHGYGWLQQ